MKNPEGVEARPDHEAESISSRRRFLGLLGGRALPVIRSIRTHRRFPAGHERQQSRQHACNGFVGHTNRNKVQQHARAEQCR